MYRGGDTHNLEINTMTTQTQNPLLAQATQVTEATPVADVAAVALNLAVLADAVAKALNPLKERLREAGITELEGTSGSTHIEGADNTGKVTVTVPSPQIRFTKSADPEGLKAMLGDSFDIYFTTKVSYAPRKNIRDVVVARAKMMHKRAADEVMSHAEALVMESIEEQQPTPRVSFKPSK
jgi:hypothetical protein